MSTGLFALLDDIATIAKVAAASLDDTAAAAAKAGAKAAGVVIDDAAVTPRYVTGFAAARELPIVGKIALGSIKNKLLFLLPGCLAISAFAPWAMSPLLMLGGAYLAFEGAEKVYEAVFGHHSDDLAPGDPDEEIDPVAQEHAMVAGAIRTDLILSAEIMAIALASVADVPLWERAVVLTVVALAITAGVYGAVALIVKADDVGLLLARRKTALLRWIGRGMVSMMPPLLAALASIGTAAMLWVGGGIIVHGLEGFGIVAPAHGIHHFAEVAGGAAGPVAQWLASAAGSGLFGLGIGAAIVALLHLRPHRKR